MVLAIAAPRQVLSRNFYNVFEMLDYMTIADRQRRHHWPVVQERVWQSIAQQEEDCQAAIVELLLSRQNGPKSDHTVRTEPIVIADAETVRWWFYQTMPLMPPLLDRRDTLVPLAMSVGVHSSLPPMVGRLSPTQWMRRQIMYWADSVANDDQRLLAERDTLHQLSRVELIEACFRRALPISAGLDDDALRRSLDQHLELVSHLPAEDDDDEKQQPKQQQLQQHKGLWSLVWNILRQSSRPTKTTTTTTTTTSSRF
jgi:LETM1-like protein